MADNKIYIGNFNIQKAYFGSSDAIEIYLGDNKVYPLGEPAPHDYARDYLTIRVLTGGTMGLANYPMEYSLDGGNTWLENNVGDRFTVSEGDAVLLKGQSAPLSAPVLTSDSTIYFDVEGNIMSLIYGDNFRGQTTLPNYSSIFADAFVASNVVHAHNLILPATTLKESCYDEMFEGCTSLVTAPVLSATTLAARCYYEMFNGCSSLSAITCLATDISATNCTYSWTNGVAANGIFTKAQGMCDWPTGVDGIPAGWQGAASCPCYQVVDDIANVSGTTYEDVYATNEMKWYKLNSNDQYEKYGIYASGRTDVPTYEGKLTIDNGHEYEYSGGTWVDLGTASGSPMPDVDFVFNYNAKDYNSTTKNIAKTFGQNSDMDATYIQGTVTDHSNDGYVTIDNAAYQICGSDKTLINRDNTQDGCQMTIISKARTGSGQSLLTNRDTSYNWMYRQKTNILTLHGTREIGSIQTNYSTPDVLSVRTYWYNDTVKVLYNNWTSGLTTIPETFAYGQQNNNDSAGALFVGYGYDSLQESWSGDFYWVFMAQNSLTDDDIRKVIEYNEEGVDYPKYYAEIQAPEDNLTFATMADANAYQCPWVGMKATISNSKYIFNDKYEWEVLPVEYRWINKTPIETYHVCSGYSCYYVEKEQESYDSGTTWSDVYPEVTRTGSKYGDDSPICGYPIYSWNLSGRTCYGVSWVDVYVYQVSTDNGETWTDVLPQQTRMEIVEECWEPCGCTPKYPYDFSVKTPNGDWYTRNDGYSMLYDSDIYDFISSQGLAGADITDIIIGENVTDASIFGDSFTNVSAITLSYKIENVAIQRFSNIESITIESLDVPHSINLEDTNCCPIYVPAESVQAYKDALAGYYDAQCDEQMDTRVEAIPEPDDDYSKMYLTVECVDNTNDTTITIADSYNTFYISTNNGMSWDTLNTQITKTISNGQKAIIKGEIMQASSSDGIGTIKVLNGEAKVYGNVMSLIYGDNFTGQTTISDYQFAGLFYQTTVVDAENLVLPAETVSNRGYRSMFANSLSLRIAPKVLPATTIGTEAYYGMFNGCTGLTTVPEISATTIGTGSCQYMFRNCSSLTTAPSILPATTLANLCYQYMFEGCSSLTTAPELPATTLATSCYYYMFNNCTSLTKAPELPATTLVSGCYSYMFSGCTSLNEITFMSLTAPSTAYTQNWVRGVPTTGGTFYKNSNATWGNSFGYSQIPGNAIGSKWTVATKTPDPNSSGT